jgi:hypothetical protein
MAGGKRIAICFTTIFPFQEFLEQYRRNIQKFGHEREVTVYVAGDNKTPADSAQIAQQVTGNGLRTQYLPIAWQNEYLKRFAFPEGMIPENSDNRRNVAYLLALEEGAEVIISVDDDNFPLEGVDFVGEHMRVGQTQTQPQAVGHNQWYNLCDLLEPKMPDLYARGFPYWARDKRAAEVSGTAARKIAMSVGLWTSDPDSDAIARLYCKPHIESSDGRQVMLGAGVRSPINTQNTALSRQAMAAYYYVFMGQPLRGMKLDRFGDIFSGYFVQVCADAVGEGISIGGPLADHRRNQHNLLVDLYQELAGIMILEDLSRFLTSVKLPSESYGAAYRSLAGQLEEFAAAQEGFIWMPETKEYFRKIGQNMRTWVDVVEAFK